MWLAQPIRRVAERTLLRTRRLNFLLLSVIAIESTSFNFALQTRSIPSILVPVNAAILPWAAGTVFAMNPFSDEGAILPTALLAADGTAYVRGLMVPRLAFSIPIVMAATAVAVTVAPYPLATKLGRVGVAAFVSCVTIVTVPAVGTRYPRFSTISIGRSKEVVPLQLLPTSLHFGATALPGGLLALLAVDPELARTVVAGLFGALPTVMVGLLAGSGGGALASAADWFGGVATQIGGVPIATFWTATRVLLIVGGLAAAAVAYRAAVARFETYSPPT